MTNSDSEFMQAYEAHLSNHPETQSVDDFQSPPEDEAAAQENQRLRSTEKKLFGRRDVYVWILSIYGLTFYGFGSAVSIILFAKLTELPTYTFWFVNLEPYLFVISCVYGLIASAMYFALRPWARRGIILAPILTMITFSFFNVLPLWLDLVNYAVYFVFLILAIFAYKSPRNRLAFGILISDSELRRITPKPRRGAIR